MKFPDPQSPTRQAFFPIKFPPFLLLSHLVNHLVKRSTPQRRRKIKKETCIFFEPSKHITVIHSHFHLPVTRPLLKKKTHGFFLAGISPLAYVDSPVIGTFFGVFRAQKIGHACMHFDYLPYMIGSLSLSVVLP